MFGNKEKSKDVDNPVMSHKSATSKDIKTLIGEGCKIEGNFFIPTATRIDGTIKGDLTGDSGIVIGNSGKVEGNICSPEIIVYGNVTGNIETNRIELKRGAIVTGDIKTNDLITEAGAVFNGKCIMKSEADNVTELKSSESELGSVKIKSVIS
ncbi:MAG: polymer-forming cytoskeletal protein [Ignavibacteria bacterium]|nr:polymer-forming cytoskeletal protein [Ignavibacteria bacterium]